MKKKCFNLSSIISFLILLLIISSCKTEPEFTEKWPEYRGTNRDGYSETTIPVVPWSKEKPINLIWKQKIGDGFSGIIINGDQLITAYGEETPEDSSEVIASFNRKTGKQIWKTKIGKLFVEEFGNGPRATPTLDGNQVFIYNSNGEVFAVDANTGKLNWQIDLTDTLKIDQFRFGHSNSPLVVGNNVIIQTGGSTENSAFVALDKTTGKINWRVGNSWESYSSPIVAKIHNVEQIIFAVTRIEEVDGKKRGIREVVSLTPDGKKLWTGPSVRSVFALPIFIQPDKIFVSSSLDVGCAMLQVTNNAEGFKADTLWKSPEMQNHFNSSVFYKDYIYGFSNATLHCIDAKTGERKWRKRGMGKGSLIIADGKLIILTDRGKLVLAEANPNKYVELAQDKVIEGLTWTSPTLADGKLYLRSREEMACYDLSK